MATLTPIPATGRTVPRWVQATGVAGTIGISAGAFWLSWTALTRLALMAGVPAWQAWAWPLIVDGLIVVATISVVTMSGRSGAWYPWLLLITAALVSVAGNAVHATLPADATLSPVLAAMIAAVPPVVLLAVTHLTAILTRSRPRPDPDTLRASEPVRSRHRIDDATSPVSPVVPKMKPPGRYLFDYLTRTGGMASAAQVIADAQRLGYTERQLSNARRRATRPVISSTKDTDTGGRIWCLEPDTGGAP